MYLKPHLKVVFSHNKAFGKDIEKALLPLFGKRIPKEFLDKELRYTSCTVIEEPHNNYVPANPGVYMGIAICSPKDIFSKSKGRKKSFGLAIHSMNLNKDSRKELWNLYFSKIPAER